MPVPSLLHVTAESRQHANKVYSLNFHQQLANGPVYFNFSKDGIFGYGFLCLSVFCGIDIRNAQYPETAPDHLKTLYQKVQFIGIGMTETSMTRAMIRLVQKFPNLNKVTFPDFHRGWDGAVLDTPGVAMRITTYVDLLWAYQRYTEENVAYYVGPAIEFLEWEEIMQRFFDEQMRTQHFGGCVMG